MRVGAEIRSPVALVLCGGGSRGAMEVGFYRAIRDLGVPVDFIIGSSIGALNGAFFCAGMRPEKVAELWCGFRRREALRINLRGLLAPWRYSAFFDLDPLRRRLREVLPVTRFEDLPVPLIVVTTDLQEGKPAYWSGTGDIVEPVISSMSLPGVFPPVEMEGRQFVDGGIANNVPLDKAVELGARTILMIRCTCCEPSLKPFRGIARVLVRSFSIALERKFAAELDHFGALVRLHSVQPRFPHEIDLLDFRYSGELIDAAYRQTIEYFTAPVAGADSLVCPSNMIPSEGVAPK
nr:patatin-like phospholipase family protein [Burkholderia gladioli]